MGRIPGVEGDIDCLRSVSTGVADALLNIERLAPTLSSVAAKPVCIGFSCIHDRLQGVLPASCKRVQQSDRYDLLKGRHARQESGGFRGRFQKVQVIGG